MAVASKDSCARRDETQAERRGRTDSPGVLTTLSLVLPLIYLAFVGAWLVYSHNWPTSDEVALALFLVAVITGRGLRFLRDWSPFVLLILAYEALRGFAADIGGRVHVGFPIDMDRRIFGQLPTNFLQAHLWDPGHLHWYDYASAYLHTSYFLVPLGFAFVLWLRDRPTYWRFVASYLLLTYAGFITYVLFPMAPPWWASNAGMIPHVDTILDTVLAHHGASHPISLAYQYFESNPVAAMPSLHAGFPMLVWLVAWRIWPRWGWALVLYPLAMGFAVVYMGEHYAIDVLAGYVYAVCAFAAVWLAPEAWQRYRSGRSSPVTVPNSQVEIPGAS